MSEHANSGPISHQHGTTYQMQAAQWAAAGRPDHAIPLYAAALEHQPQDTRARLALADCLVRCGQVSAAAGEYMRASLDYAARRRDNEAMALAFQVLRLDARHLVYVAVADALRRIGRQARELCARAAEAHLAAGRITDGLHMLRLGAEIDARNPQVRRRLAALYRSQHMTSDAVVHLAEAGRLLLAAGNNAEYIEVAEEILALDPRHLPTLRELPRSYLRIGEPRHAVVKLADLMRVSPGDTIGYETLAHAFVAIGRDATGLSVLERLVAELRSNGRTPQADAILERAQGWRIDDAELTAAVLALRAPKAPPPPPAPRARPAPTAAEGTVVLDISDLLAANKAEEDEAMVLDASDVVELDDGEGTVVLRLQDLSHVGPAPRRPAPPPPPRRPPPPRSAMPPRPPTHQTRRTLPPLPRTQLEATQVLEVDELELDADTQVKAVPGDVTSVIYDDDSGELHGDDPETLRLVGCLEVEAERMGLGSLS